MKVFRTGFLAVMILTTTTIANLSAAEGVDFRPDREVLKQQVEERLYLEQDRLNKDINETVASFLADKPRTADAVLKSRHAIYQSIVLHRDAPSYRL